MQFYSIFQKLFLVYTIYKDISLLGIFWGQNQVCQIIYEIVAKNFNNLNFQCLVKLYPHIAVEYNYKNSVKGLSDMENVHNTPLNERRKLQNSMICDPKWEKI